MKLSNWEDAHASKNLDRPENEMMIIFYSEFDSVS